MFFGIFARATCFMNSCENNILIKEGFGVKGKNLLPEELLPMGANFILYELASPEKGGK